MLNAYVLSFLHHLQLLRFFVWHWSVYSPRLFEIVTQRRTSFHVTTDRKPSVILSLIDGPCNIHVLLTNRSMFTSEQLLPYHQASHVIRPEGVA